MDKAVLHDITTNAAAGLVAGAGYEKQIAALAAHIYRDLNGRPYRINGAGGIEIVERLLPTPSRRRGEVTFYEGLSFARFVNRFKNASTVIFADAIDRSFTAALDYHPGSPDPGAASWDQFRAVLPLRHTPSWETWAAATGKPMEQVAFSVFLEDQIVDIADPDGALLVEIARTLEAKADVQFESHIRMDNGAHRFQYIENVQGSTGGKLDIPQEFTLALQPFEGSKTYAVKARFRYRITGKKLLLWFDLVRLQDVLKEAFDDELTKIQGEVGEALPIYKGPAPAAQQPKD